MHFKGIRESASTLATRGRKDCQNLPKKMQKGRRARFPTAFKDRNPRWLLARRLCRRIHLLHGTGVLGADEGDDLPQLVGGFDDPTEGRHRPDNHFLADALVTFLLELVGAKSDQPEN